MVGDDDLEAVEPDELDNAPADPRWAALSELEL